MIKWHGRKARSDCGFTVIELMVTTLILGILVGIVVMTMSISRRKAKESACKANLRTLIDGLILYKSTHDGAYPDDLEDLAPDYIKGSFDWICPEGNTDYRLTYDSITGEVHCNEPGHEI